MISCNYFLSFFILQVTNFVPEFLDDTSHVFEASQHLGMMAPALNLIPRLNEGCHFFVHSANAQLFAAVPSIFSSNHLLSEEINENYVFLVLELFPVPD